MTTARLGWRTRCFPFSSLSITYSFTRLSNYLLNYLLVYLFTYLFTHLSVYLLIHLLIYPFTCLFINPYLNINFPLFYFPFSILFSFLYLLIYFRPCIQFYIYIFIRSSIHLFFIHTQILCLYLSNLVRLIHSPVHLFSICQFINYFP